MKKLFLIPVLLGTAFLMGGATRSKEYVGKLRSMPDFCQRDTTYGTLPENGEHHCGPTAVSNALCWLYMQGCERLLPGKGPGPKEQFELIRILGTDDYMGTASTGTSRTRLMNGLKKYAFEKGYRSTIEYMGWTTKNYRVGPTPQVPWMLDRMSGNSDLIINIGFYTFDPAAKRYRRSAGHYVTAVGYDVSRDTVFVYIHDPSSRSGMQKRSEKCQLVPLADGTTMQNKDGDPFSGEGFFRLDGVKLKGGSDCAIIDGAIAFALL